MRHIVLTLLLFVCAQSVTAQQEIVIDHVTNSIGDSLLIAGNTHIISIRYRNFPPDSCICNFNPNNGYVLYSPDGATWNSSYGTISTEFMAITSAQMFLNHYDDPTVGGDTGEGPNDGVSPDFLVLSSICFACHCGLYDEFDEIALRIEIQSNLSDSGLHICIDSSSIGVLGKWRWFPAGQRECDVAPDWGGPYCFTIVQPTCGDVNTDGQITIDDIDFLIQFYFGFGDPPLPFLGDVNDDGTIDIGDIIYLANYLHNNGPAPCATSGPGGHDWKQSPDSHQSGND